MSGISWWRKQYLRKFDPTNLSPFEASVYSQNGEDGIIEELFHRIGTHSKYGVEFGVEDGAECNSRRLLEDGWRVLRMDGSNSAPTIKQEFITAENINKLFKKYDVPHNLDFLCIDIDFNDYWVWKAIDEEFNPRLVVVEYNASVSPAKARTVKYDAKRIWDGSDYFGGSLRAMAKLARSRGYSLVYCESRGVNAFFVRNDLLNDRVVKALSPAEAYVGPGYGHFDDDGASGHPQSKEHMIEV
jgi:hypothetical protein